MQRRGSRGGGQGGQLPPPNFLSQWDGYARPKRAPPLRSQGHCFSRPQVTRSPGHIFMRKLKQHRSQVVFLNCRGRAVALKMAPGRRSRKPPLGPHMPVPPPPKIWQSLGKSTLLPPPPPKKKYRSHAPAFVCNHLGKCPF